jgi:DNA-binding phage protein
METKEIISRLRDVKDKAAFAKACKLSRATLYRLLDPDINPTFKTLRKIEKQLEKEQK